MHKINHEVIEVKPENWEKFKDIRTRAIMDSPQAFVDNLEETLTRQKEQWISWVTRPKVYVVEENEVYGATATLRQNPTTQIWTINGVGVNTEQISAINLYESLGFEKTEEIPNIMMGDGNEYNAIEMRKRL
jgi:hypothetical protein